MLSLARWIKRLTIIVILSLMTAGIASAQTYHIRVTQNTNMRASHSLQSGIVETVPAGTTLQVGGSFNRWLSISRNAEVWMADWVPYDRVESAQTPSDVNNCCFVDRQCATDQEWTDGYWAYRRNECSAPAQSPQQTTTQPANTAPAITDNYKLLRRSAMHNRSAVDSRLLGLSEQPMRWINRFVDTIVGADPGPNFSSNG